MDRDEIRRVKTRLSNARARGQRDLAADLERELRRLRGLDEPMPPPDDEGIEQLRLF